MDTFREPGSLLTRLVSKLAPLAKDTDWDLGEEAIAVKIRWFGLAVGAVLANFGSPGVAPQPLNLILLLGLGFTALDTFFFTRRRVFLRDFPIVISAMESIFIGLLCYFQGGLDSPFRFYYLLSLVCCAIRYSPSTTFLTCGFDCISYAVLYFVQPADRRDPQLLALMVVVLIWVSWAVSGLAKLLKRAGERLRALNAELQENKNQLETRIAERTQELQESQAQVLHQEKMAAFGLLAAGIAHEVGNPLTSISSLVQILEQRDLDEYTRNKLGQVSGQLVRIQAILRELVNFSRPASNQRVNCSIREVIDESLSIAKYYKGGKNRNITVEAEAGMPLVPGVRDQLVQIVFNLVLNAIDATGKGGTISIRAKATDGRMCLQIADDGIGIATDVHVKLFRPYFTTKKHGTGLGLFVIKKIVEEHSGTVRFESSPGHGTTFTIELPTVPDIEGTEVHRDHREFLSNNGSRIPTERNDG